MNQNQKPIGRWFQFRLSTWFVVVAIFALVIAARPWLTARHDASLSQSIHTYSLNEMLLIPSLVTILFVTWKAYWSPETRFLFRNSTWLVLLAILCLTLMCNPLWTETETIVVASGTLNRFVATRTLSLNPRLLLPGAILFAFLVWKLCGFGVGRQGAWRQIAEEDRSDPRQA